MKHNKKHQLNIVVGILAIAAIVLALAVLFILPKLSSATDIVVSPENGKNIITGGEGNDTLNGGNGADIIIGGAGNDILNGGNGPDTLNGGEGSDTLAGDNGPDNMSGGAGNDIYILEGSGSLNDIVEESVNEGTDIIISPVTYTLGNNVENLLLSGVRAINGMGNDLNNIIIGNSDNNIIIAQAGDDAMIGGAGGGSDILIGGDGSDVLIGSGGNDIIMIGGTDNDIMIGSGGEYTVDYNNGNESYTFTSYGNGEYTLINDSSSEYYTFTSDSDTEYTMTGGEGSDTFYYGFTIDSPSSYSLSTIMDWQLAENDKIDLTSLTYVTSLSQLDLLATQIGPDTVFNWTAENKLIVKNVNKGSLLLSGNIVLHEPTGVTINGTSGNDTVDATHTAGDEPLPTNGDDFIYGNSGNDVIDGLGGNDVLDGGEDTDTVTGDGGSDTFVFSSGYGHDTFTDFLIGEDKIDFTGLIGYSNFDDLEELIEASGSDTVIDFGNENSLTLKNVSPENLTAGDFIFVEWP